VQPINKRISLTLRMLRKNNRWSLDRAALETGVSKAMLGQIERGESSPTIATLWKITSGFGTTFSAFLEDQQMGGSTTLLRSSNVKKLTRHKQKLKVIPIFPYDKELHCEMFIIELLPSCELLSAPHKVGVIEHVLVTEGTMEVLLNGLWKVLHKGEGLRFAADVPHGYRNITAKKACIHNVIHYPANT
jgi:transcriptional regulator with XRE-family HTH domain